MMIRSPSEPFGGGVLAGLILSRRFGGACVEVGSGSGSNTRFLAGPARFSVLACIDGDPKRMDLSPDGTRIWQLGAFISPRRDVYFNRGDGKLADFVSEIRISEQSEPVSAIPLDEAVSGLGRIDLLCVDVDNYEIEVLDSSTKLIRNHSPEICIKAGAGSWEIIDARLARLGYRLLKRFPDDYNYYVPGAALHGAFASAVKFLPRGIRSPATGAFGRFMMWLRSLPRRSRLRPGTPPEGFRQGIHHPAEQIQEA